MVLLSRPSRRRGSYFNMPGMPDSLNWLFPFYSVGSTYGSYPLVNVWGNSDKATVTAEVPGVNVDDINISVEGQSLEMTGKRNEPDIGDGKEYHRRERNVGTFKREISLPFEVDPDSVSASYQNGVLTVEMDRHEKDKPRKIQVKSGAR